MPIESRKVRVTFLVASLPEGGEECDEGGIEPDGADEVAPTVEECEFEPVDGGEAGLSAAGN